MKLHIKSVRPTGILTAVVSVAWMASFIARTLIPTLSFGPAVDTAMLLVLGYWFSVNGMSSKDGGRKWQRSQENKGTVNLNSRATPGT